MKVIKTLLAIGVMTASFAPHAEVGLNFHRDLSPIIVNGEGMGYALFSNSEHTLDNGTNQIVFRMSRLIENGGERDKFNSDAFVLSFDAEDIDLRLEPVMRVLRGSDGIEFNRNPKVALVDEAGNHIKFTIDTLPAGKALIRDYEKDLVNYNKVNGIATEQAELAVVQAVAATEAAPVVKVVTVNTGEVGPVSMIQYWMEKATPVENDKFMTWAFENRALDSVKPIEGSQALNMLGYWYSEAKVDERKKILAWLISQ
ncbi:DUF2057 domain-containing protein [Vibrio renipiscarius]|uniref:Uncharacterized protein n=1 Tax=Vibrio renipiscarius TaxID=1461322 RepID=A0A0C2KIW9_9VIBR|nr:DUF2057 domain-containing protein [Vibrio renipiscarius]KII80461.1 hypothetical protein OJ16_03815 [Vibrio renipiscarius]KII82278.1 hypothetical protein PL18_01405 [Vibrio renipiscarius]